MGHRFVLEGLCEERRSETMIFYADTAAAALGAATEPRRSQNTWTAPTRLRI